MDGRMIGNDLIVTTRRHTCCECRTMETPLRQEKKSPNCSSPSVISSLQARGERLFPTGLPAFVSARSHARRNWSLLEPLKTVEQWPSWPLHRAAITTPYFPEFREEERERERVCVISIGGGAGIYSIALNATPSAFNRRLYSLHVTSLCYCCRYKKNMKIFPFFFFFLLVPRSFKFCNLFFFYIDNSDDYEWRLRKLSLELDY